ncbi:MAG TPA: ABC transporter ATP-binding protein [Casimicrobiaceae bacterium]|nr:ABC transporter ATP-binding protein [Casimicrobiaceae bacterium]
MGYVALRSVTKRFGNLAVVDALDLEVRQGEFLTLLGPSGCGKTTTLRMIAGFIRPTRGRILIAGEDVTEAEVQQRQIGMVFQDYALFPHLTAFENIAFGLVERGVARERIARRVAELLELVRLPEVRDRYPGQMSGGQQQRVALARAIAHPPRVLLMDEPLGALDLKMREHMQLELRRIQQELGLTAIYVTHDQTEAMTMSDRIAVMNAGHIEQLDAPERIYGSPRTRFVAHFVGKVNFIHGAIINGDATFSALATPDGVLRCPAVAGHGSGPVTVAVRPEHMSLRPAHANGDDANVVRGRIAAQSFAGNVRHYAVRVHDEHLLLVETRPGDTTWSVGDEVGVAWRPEHGVVVADSPSRQTNEGANA